MGTPGVKLNLSKEAIVTALKEKKGIISHTAKKLNIAPYTLRKKINEYPDVKELLNNLRHDYETTLMDLAENCVAASISKLSEDPTNALKAAIYTLNSRGKERGWNNTLEGLSQKTIFVSNYDPRSQEQVLPETVSATDTEIPAQRD